MHTIVEAASTLSEAERALVSGVITCLGFVGADEREFETREIADVLGFSPVALEGALLKAARLSSLPLLYRSWERGLVLALDENAPAVDTFTDDLFAAQRERAGARLGAMHHYARTTGCRRRFLLEYLGDSYTASNCSACDRCAAALVWPWPDGAAALPTLTGGVDTTWEIVAALARLAEPPTYKQFLTALRGQERYGAGGQHSVRRDLLAADWFGRLQYVLAGRVEAALEELCGRGLVATEQATWTSNNEVRTFERLILTEAGRAAYQARRLPDSSDIPDRQRRWRSA